jgi:hypothetical protein
MATALRTSSGKAVASMAASKPAVALVEDNIRYEVVIDVATAQVREQRRVLLRASAGLGAGTVMSDRVVQQHGLGTQDRRAPSDGDAG